MITMSVPTKTCQTCDNIFEKPKNISMRVWGTRRFCSAACFGVDSARHQRTLFDKPCANCSKSFRPFNRHQQYCSLDCAKVRFIGIRGENHQSWRGGRTIDPSGYVRVNMSPDHRFAKELRMAHGYAQEHRLVMSEMLGRPLQKHETVHHINGKRDDNRPENLELRTGKHGKGATKHCLTCTCVESKKA